MGTTSYQDVKETRDREEEAERLRLYYVAMTRAMERLIVSGSVDRSSERDERTPIGWVLQRLRLGEELDRTDVDGPVEVERGAAGIVLRIDRFAPAPAPRRLLAAAEAEDPSDDEGQLVLFEGAGEDVPAAAPRLRDLVEIPAPALTRVARLSYSAISLHDRCGYRYFAERVVGMRPAPWDGAGRRRCRRSGRPSSDRDRRCGAPAARARRPRGALATRRRRPRGAGPRLVSDGVRRRAVADRRSRAARTRARRSRRGSPGFAEPGPSGRSPSSSTECS